MDLLNYLPTELISEIIDYNDYEKYYKKDHVKNFKNVLLDIHNMNEIMCTISPTLTMQCWGNKPIHFDWDDYMEDNEMEY
jgi:hypothetical protein